MNWSVKFKNEGIELFYHSYPKGTYNLLPENCCAVCAYPDTQAGRCPWDADHPVVVKRIYAIGRYYTTGTWHSTGESDPLSRDIYLLKNDQQKAEPLGLSIAACMQHRYPELLVYDYLVAVPQYKSELHIDKRTNEFFNPIDPLVSWISSEVRMEVIAPLAKTMKQSMEGLDMLQRREATRGLYKCNSDQVEGKRILLVDDVSTTGSNLDSCAKELIAHGAIEVRAIVCGKNYSS